MRTFHRLLIASFAAVFAACTSAPKVAIPDERQALARAGSLRVAFLATTPIHATKDPASGEFTGPAVDLGKEMARRIGARFEPVAYSSFPPILAGAKSGEWDIAMMGTSEERAKLVDFTAPYMVVEFGYLVRDGSSISSLADVDKPRVQIATLEKSSPDAYLSRTIRQATLVRFPTMAEMVASLKAGKVDAVYATKAAMLAQSAKIAGSRVLEDRGGEETAIAVPKGRKPAAEYARKFVEEAKSAGLVKAAIERAGLRGVVVAQPR
jgi:polar amino acid transport system substrate-binding protein